MNAGNHATTATVAVNESEKDGKKIYHAGTLRYTFSGLLIVMLWLLWGDFCFTLMETVFPAVLPLMLGNLKTPNWVIALIMTTIPGILNATICPIVSFWSDRYRSPLGRRIPFIIYTIPFLSLFLGLIGAAPRLISWLSKIGILQNSVTATVVLIGIFAAGFQFFNMFVASVYYYLFNDVVPPQFLGRFLSVFRLVGVLAGGAFYLFVFPWAETHYFEIFLGAALLYGVVFWMMCRKVREGEYEPPPEVEGRLTFWRGVRAFFKESYTLRFYWYFYMAVSFSAAATTANIFLIFFARSVGLSLEQFGRFTAVGATVLAALLVPFGILCDKLHPLRTMLIATTAQSLLSALPLVFLLFGFSLAQGFTVWCVVFGLAIPFQALLASSELPTFMKLLPKNQFGQFCASTAVVRSLCTMLAGLICGLLIDWLKGRNPDPMFAYRYLPIWYVIFQAGSAISLWFLYFEWRKRGGRDGYVPPEVVVSPEFGAVAKVV